MPRTTSRRVRRPAPVALLVASGLLLAGCSPAPSAGDAAVSAFQARVLAVTESAAEEDFPGALDDLSTLSTEVDFAFTRGEITSGRRDLIQSAIRAVTEQLTAAMAPEPAEEPGDGTSGQEPGEAEEPEAEDTPAPEDTPTPEDTPAP
jgi:hypothetical protein